MYCTTPNLAKHALLHPPPFLTLPSPFSSYCSHIVTIASSSLVEVLVSSHIGAHARRELFASIASIASLFLGLFFTVIEKGSFGRLFGDNQTFKVSSNDRLGV
jgi:hypothetical protein